MSYLKQLLNNKPGEMKVQSFGSIESLLKTVVPPNELKTEPSPEIVAKNEKVEAVLNEANDAIEAAKRYAEKILTTPEEKRQIEKIDEEIKHDIDEALNESVSIQEAVNAQNYYKLYRDKDETFECKISVEGSSLNNSFARLVLESSDSWNIFFSGKIYKDGRCVVPLKKMSIFPEGTIGKARLEIVIDDLMFVPWEETFIVEGSKKVTVEIKPQSKVSVNLKDTE